MITIYKRRVFSILAALGFVLASAQSQPQLRADGSYAPVDSDSHPGSLTYKTMNTVVCPPVAGITCTLNGPSSSTYLGAPAGCNAGSFAGSNPWDGGSASGFVSWAFSSPIKAVTLKAGSVNTNDFATHTISGGTPGTISISALVCLSSLSGMTIGAFTGACCGDVSWTINSTGTFTFVNLANTGGASGWIAECPSFISTLPIELMSFDGTCGSDNKIILEWKTISETNNAYFTIERSADAATWDILGNVKGAGTSNSIRDYSFTDGQPLRGTSYFRLKQTDFDGTYKYSPIITVDNCSIGSDVKLYPNPASSNIIAENGSFSNTTLEVYNVLGLKIASYDLGYGENKIDVSAFDNGSYLFKVVNEGSVVKTHHILVNN